MLTGIDPLKRAQVAQPSVRDEWIAQAASSGRLCLVCGAGLSMPFGVPSWTELTNALLGSPARRKKRGNASASKEFQLEQLVRDDFGGSYEAFHGRVAELLYANRLPNWKRFGAQPALEALAMLCALMVRKGRVQIVTFNYDSYLEEFLRSRGLSVAAHIEADRALPDAEVIIHHPHGFLPFEAQSQYSARIVLDQKDYMETRVSQWWPLFQRPMIDSLCLFLGLSATCPNLDSLALDTMKLREQKNGSGYWGVALGRDGDTAAAKRWDQRGVWSVGVGAKFQKSAHYLQGIMQLMR